MPAIIRTLGLLLLLLTICVCVAHCQEAAPQATDPAWKVPVANFDEAFAKAKYYFERPEHDAAEFYLRECLRFGVPKAKHDVTDAMCRCMLAVVRAQQGYGFEATITIMDVCNAYPNSEACLDIAADAAHRCAEVRAKTLQDPAVQPEPPAWMVKVSSYEQANDLAMKYRDGPRGEYYFRRCLELGVPTPEDDYWCRISLCHALSDQSSPEKASEAYANALCARLLHTRPYTLIFVVEALVACGDFDRAKRYLALLDRQLPSKLDPGTLEFLVDQGNRTALTTRTLLYTIDVPYDLWRKLNDSIDGQPAMYLSVLQDIPGKRVTGWSLTGAASYKEKVNEMGTRYLEVMLIPGNDLHYSATVEEKLYSFLDAYREYKDAPLPGDVAENFLGRSIGPDGTVYVDPYGPYAQHLASFLKGPNRLESSLNVLTWSWCLRGATPVESAVMPPTSEGGLQYRAILMCEHGAFTVAALLRACGVPADCLRGFSVIDGILSQKYAHTVPRAYISGWLIPRWRSPVSSELDFWARWRYTGKKVEFHGLPIPPMDLRGADDRHGGMWLDCPFPCGACKVLDSRIEPPK